MALLPTGRADTSLGMNRRMWFHKGLVKARQEKTKVVVVVSEGRVYDAYSNKNVAFEFVDLDVDDDAEYRYEELSNSDELFSIYQ
jgi:hypothetical protein